MSITTILYIVAIILLLSLSGFFSGSETALFSLKRWQIKRLESSDRTGSLRISKLLDRPRKLLITILVGNLLVNVTASTVAESFCHRFFGDNSVLITITGMIIFLLLFGEITPKVLAVNYARTFALYVSLPMLVFQKLIAPIQNIIYVITIFFIRLFGGSKSPEEIPISREEIHKIVDMGIKDGVVEPHEQQLISRIVQLGTKKIKDIAQPLDSIFALEEGTPPETAMSKIMEKGYSRIPVYRGQKSNMVGILYLKDFLPYWFGIKPLTSLKPLIHKPLKIRANQRALNVLRILRMKKQHLALVTDKKLHVIGLITIQDLVNILVGKETIGENSSPDPGDTEKKNDV
jgi:putative hemolysin